MVNALRRGGGAGDQTGEDEDRAGGKPEGAGRAEQWTDRAASRSDRVINPIHATLVSTLGVLGQHRGQRRRQPAYAGICQGIEYEELPEAAHEDVRHVEDGPPIPQRGVTRAWPLRSPTLPRYTGVTVLASDAAPTTSLAEVVTRVGFAARSITNSGSTGSRAERPMAPRNRKSSAKSSFWLERIRRQLWRKPSGSAWSWSDRPNGSSAPSHTDAPEVNNRMAVSTKVVRNPVDPGGRLPPAAPWYTRSAPRA